MQAAQSRFQPQHAEASPGARAQAATAAAKAVEDSKLAGKVAGSDLRVVVMSATLEADKYADYFGGADVQYVEGRQFPVKVRSRSRKPEPAAGRGEWKHLPHVPHIRLCTQSPKTAPPT